MPSCSHFSKTPELEQEKSKELEMFQRSKKDSDVMFFFPKDGEGSTWLTASPGRPPRT